MRRLVDPRPEDERADGFGEDNDELIGLPHGGGWGRRPGEDFIRCGEHGWRADEH